MASKAAASFSRWCGAVYAPVGRAARIVDMCGRWCGGKQYKRLCNHLEPKYYVTNDDFLKSFPAPAITNDSDDDDDEVGDGDQDENEDEDKDDDHGNGGC